ncbi:MAG: deoxynucleoside kinase [Rhodobacter sp.]|jgi:dTMP kinase|nr:deoxynucleoside kinase [Rhodobacter sp.]
MFIAICGIDGSGKTTLAKMLATKLQGSSDLPRATYTKLISADSDIMKYFNLFKAEDPSFDSRVQNYVFAFERLRAAIQDLTPLLERHDHVVVDRYVYCDLAFAKSRGHDNGVHRAMLRHLPRPDVCFVTDVAVDLALRRIHAREIAPTPDQETEPLLTGARQAYLELAEEFGFSVIDSSADPDTALDRMLQILAGIGVHPA